MRPIAASVHIELPGSLPGGASGWYALPSGDGGAAEDAAGFTGLYR